jgi:hypothetical protein
VHLKQFVRAIYLSRYSPELLVGMFYATFFDASGQGHGYDILTVAGAAAPIKKWERFDAQWRAALNQAGVKQWHATDFASSKGEYKDWKKGSPRRTAFLRKLEQIIRANTNKLFSCSVEIAAWESVNTEYCLEEFFYSPYALAGCAVVESTLKWARKKSGQHEFFFEDGDHGWQGLVKLCERIKIVPFRVSKKIATPCQAGDMLAWKTRIAATNSLRHIGKMKLAHKKPELMSLGRNVISELAGWGKTMVRPADHGIYVAENLRQICEKNKVPKRSSPVTALQT